jgi:hypothetical protein
MAQMGMLVANVVARAINLERSMLKCMDGIHWFCTAIYIKIMRYVRILR